MRMETFRSVCDPVSRISVHKPSTPTIILVKPSNSNFSKSVLLHLQSKMESNNSIICPQEHCMIAVEEDEQCKLKDISPKIVYLTEACKSIARVEELLRPLQKTRHIFIKEYAKTLKFSFKATNKFQIFNSNGDCIFFVVENTSIFTRMFCRGIVPFNLKVLSLKGEEVMEIRGQPGCRSFVIVKDFRKQQFGIIRQNNDCCTPRYSVSNYDDLELLSLDGPDGANCCFSWANCGNVDFDVKLTDGITSIGRISKEWDMAMEDLCGVRFPSKMDVRMKALLVGAVFLLDFSFYEAREGSCCLNRCCFTVIILLAFVGFLLLITR